MHKRLSLGKVDYNGSGRRNCLAALTWSLKDGCFSMSGEIWNPRGTDLYCGGQCVDTVAAFFPYNKKVQRMLAIWKEWHLNDMQAGSPKQTAHIKTLGEWQYGQDGFTNYYMWVCAELKKVGLEPDASYFHDGMPYSYGSAWLVKELPDDVVAEIEAW